MLLASSVQLFDPSLTEFALAMVVAKEQTFALVADGQVSVHVAAMERSFAQLLGAGIA